jgi:hypothetical protein
MTSSGDDDAEFSAMKTVYETLKALDAPGQGRVLEYVVGRLGIDWPGRKLPSRKHKTDTPEDEAGDDAPASKFDSFAELHAAFDPSTDSERALVAGYWLQVCQQAPSFDAQSANSELKNLGHPLSNVTVALTTLIKLKPSQVLQLKKSGNTRQARKTYKLTTAGIAVIEAKVNG